MSLLSKLGLKKCTHDKLGLYSRCGYCPECGEYIENQWYLVRCSCCGVKRIAITKGTKILPKDTFCSNCGEQEYYIEKLNQVNFIDINYATVIQSIKSSNNQDFTQTWINISTEPKLLCAY